MSFQENFYNFHRGCVRNFSSFWHNFSVAAGSTLSNIFSHMHAHPIHTKKRKWYKEKRKRKWTIKTTVDITLVSLFINSEHLFVCWIKIFGTLSCLIICVLSYDGGYIDILVKFVLIFEEGRSSLFSFFKKMEFCSPIHLATGEYIFCVLSIALLNWKILKLNFCFLPELLGAVEKRTLPETPDWLI